MWTITTIADSYFMGFDEVIFRGDYENARIKFNKLTARYGNLFKLTFNMF